MQPMTQADPPLWFVEQRLVLAGVRVLVRSTTTEGWQTILDGLPHGRGFAPDLAPVLVYSLIVEAGGDSGRSEAQHWLYRGGDPISGPDDLAGAAQALQGDVIVEV